MGLARRVAPPHKGGAGGKGYRLLGGRGGYSPEAGQGRRVWPALGGQGPQGRALGFTGAQAVRVCLPTQEAQVRALLGELEIKSLHVLWCSQNKQNPLKKFFLKS